MILIDSVAFVLFGRRGTEQIESRRRMEIEVLVPIRDNVEDEALMFDHINMEIKTGENGVGVQKGGVYAPASENGEGSSVVFSRDGPLVRKESVLAHVAHDCNSSEQNPKSMLVVTDFKKGRKGKSSHDKKLSRQDRFELGRLFQGAVSSHDWGLAESLIALADPQTLNDALCITLDSIWFLSTQQELHGITGLIKNIIVSGAYDFTRAALRTSFLASCVSACQSRTMSLADTVTVMAQR